jgi:MoaA/NifB/PqqE/SkfB family radical SAM enzyme
MPWSSIQINPSGDFKICCFSGLSDEEEKSAENSHGMAVDDDGKVMNIFTHSILEAMNSKYHKELRLAQSRGERHPICKVCWDREDANKTDQQPVSMRNFRSFIQLKNANNAVTLDNVQDHLTPEGTITDFPISLDLRFTNVCNLKCIMCNSVYSNQWYSDEVAMTGKTTIKVDSKFYNIRVENNVYKTDMPVWHDSPEWWNQFDKFKDRIQHIYLTGGEPFLIKGHQELLDRLIFAGKANTIILDYDTNLTVINPVILNKLKLFKQVNLRVSIDDIGERYELIRFPGKFNTVIQNIEKLKEYGFNVQSITECTGIYSLFSPIRLYDYFTSRGHDHFSFRFLRFPSHMNIALLPDHLKDIAIKTYEDSNMNDYWKGYHINFLKNNYGVYPKEVCESSLREHIKYMDKLDELRGTDWKATFPEIADLLKEYLP